MNLFGSIGSGLGKLGGAIGKGANAWLDFAAMGGAGDMLNQAYGGALPDDVRGQLRRSYLQNIAQGIAMGQPGAAPILQQQTIGNMAQNGMQNQLRQAIAGAVNPDGTPNYAQLAAIYARLGDPENANRYATLAEQQQNNVISRQKGQMENQQQVLALKAQLFGRANDQRSYDAALAQARRLGINDMPEMFNPQFVANTVQNGLSYIQQQEQNYRASAEARAAKIFGPQFDKAVSDATIAKQTSTGDVPLTTEQKWQHDNNDRAFNRGVFESDRSFNRGVFENDRSAAQRDRELGYRGQEVGGFLTSLRQQPVEMQKRYVGLSMMAPVIENYKNLLANYSPLDPPNSANYVRIQNAYTNVITKAKEAFGLGVINGPDMVLIKQAIQDPYSAVSRALRNGQGKFDAKGVLLQSATDMQNNFAQELAMLKQLYGYQQGNAPAPMVNIPQAPPSMLQRMPTMNQNQNPGLPKGVQMPPLSPWDAAARRKAGR